MNLRFDPSIILLYIAASVERYLRCHTSGCTSPIPRNEGMPEVCYAANELGGIHYNSKRLPSQEERHAFHLLTEAYDWEDQAVTHAGLICTALIAVELMLCEDVRSLIPALA